MPRFSEAERIPLCLDSQVAGKFPPRGGDSNRIFTVMLLAIIAIILGFACLIWSADQFVAGAASIAKNLGMSPIMIGLTIVSLGTSAPEVLVSITAALTGSGSLAIGNAIGSNIANVGLVLGVTLLVVPLLAGKHYIKREIPILLAAMAGAGLLISDGEASAIDGLLMLIALAGVLWWMIRSQSKDQLTEAEVNDEPLPDLSPQRAWLTFFIGLGVLILSSRALVWGATEIAQALGMSELVIGLTIVAIGTSLPELAASIAGALRGHTDIALGNVVGSNLFNLLGVMAIPGIINTQAIGEQVFLRDYLSMVGITGVLTLAMLWGLRSRHASGDQLYLNRSIGALLLALYAGYYYWLFATAMPGTGQ